MRGTREEAQEKRHKLLKDMTTLPRAFWVISLTAILQMMASTGYQPLVPQLAVSIGISGSTLGTLFALAGIVPVIVALPIGALIDRIGVKRVLIWGAISRASASLALSLAPSFGMILASLTLNSASFLLTEVGQQAFIAGLGKGRDTEKNFGWFTFAMGLGTVPGPLISGVVKDRAGFGTAFMVASAVSLTTLLVIRMLDEHRVESDRPPMSMVGLLRACKPVLQNTGVLSAILIVIFLYFNLGAWEVYLPALLAQRRFTATQIGMVVSTFTLATMLARPLLSAGTDILGRHGLAVFGLAVGAAGLASVPMLRSVSLLMLAAAACGVGRGLVPLLSLVTISDQTTVEERGFALSVRMMAIRLQSVVNPLVFGAAAGARGTASVFLLAGALMGLSSVWVRFTRLTQNGLRRRVVSDE